MSILARIFDPNSKNIAKVTEAGALQVSAFGGSGPVATYRTRHLRDTAGSSDAAIDGSVTPVEFFTRPPPGEVWRIARLLVTFEASSISAAYYGPVGVGILTNGIRLYIADDDREVNDLLDGDTIKKSAEWVEYCFDAEVKAWGAGNDFLTARWTFTKAGVPLRLNGNRRERFVALIQDDLTGLVAHEFVVQGYREGETYV